MVYDYTFKVALVGDGAVGKTSLIKKYVDDAFTQNYHLTVGADFYKKEVVIDNKRVALSLWDIGGQVRFESIQGIFLARCDGIIYVFDLTELNTFNNLIYWKEKNKGNNEKHSSCRAVLVGNKHDLIKDTGVIIPDYSIDAFIEANPDANISKYFMTSAKDGTEVNEMFMHLGKQILEAA